jgi:hypothetical protein
MMSVCAPQCCSVTPVPFDPFGHQLDAIMAVARSCLHVPTAAQYAATVWLHALVAMSGPAVVCMSDEDEELPQPARSKSGKRNRIQRL